MINAKCFEIFIASPGDVLTERQIVKEVVYKINTIKAKYSHVVLLPIGWEDAIPGMGKPPQEIINSQLLVNADLLIGVFYSRIGSKTEKAISGTVDEIQTHIENKKPAMIYFSEKPLPQNFKKEQFNQLTKFKEWVKSTGLYGTFKDEGEFRELLFKNLLSFIESDLAFIYDNKHKTQHIFLDSMENKSKLYAGIIIGWCSSICEYFRENPTAEKINKEKVREIIENHQKTLQLMLEEDGLILNYKEKFKDLVVKIAVHYRFKDELKYNAFLLGAVGQLANIAFDLKGNSARMLKEHMKGQLEHVFPEILDDKNNFFSMLEKYHSCGTPGEYYELLIRYFNGEI